MNTLRSNNQLTIEDAISKMRWIMVKPKISLIKLKKIDENLGREKLIYKKMNVNIVLKIFKQ